MIFGIEVKGTSNPSSLVNSNGILKKTVATSAKKHVQGSNFPVGLMLVNVNSESARFGWLLEPGARYGKLASSEHVHTMEITNVTLDLAVQQVAKWCKKHG